MFTLKIPLEKNKLKKNTIRELISEAVAWEGPQIYAIKDCGTAAF